MPRSSRYKLVGRPGYVARTPQGLMPIEVKSRGRAKGSLVACWFRRPWACLSDRESLFIQAAE